MRKLRLTSLSYENHVFLDLPTRLAKYLIDLADRYGHETERGLEIDMKLSQRELGNHVGATRESINKQLQVWRVNDTIDIVDQRILIKDQSELERLAQPSN